MKKLLVLTLLFSSSINVVANSDIDFSLSDFCYEQPNVQDRNGIYFLPNQEIGITDTSICIFKNRGGQYESKGQLLNGNKDGKWFFWLGDGSKSRVQNWDNGKQITQTSWYGGRRFENIFKNGEVSTIIQYDSNERIVGEYSYNTLEYDSNEKKYHFYENGILERTSNMISRFGKGLTMHGKWESWYENGQKKDESNYKYGVSIGHWTEWYENGQMMLDITSDDDGEFDGTHRSWYKNGILSGKSHYSKGEYLGGSSWDKVGKCTSGDCLKEDN